MIRSPSRRRCRSWTAHSTASLAGERVPALTVPVGCSREVVVAESIVLTIPRMYADHHVQRVRESLLAIEGVREVRASSMDRQVEVTFEPGEVSAAAIDAALSQAGYVQEGAEEALETAVPGDGSAWRRGTARVTRTNPADARMAGDFRKY